MKTTPKGWPRLACSPVYQEGGKAIEWLCKAFGFEVRLRVEGEGGAIEHSELVFGEAVVMVCDERAAKAKGRHLDVSPKTIGGQNTQNIMLYVDDADAHCVRAREAGAKILYEPKTTDYGADHWADKSYQCEDLEGHRWWFCERVRG